LLTASTARAGGLFGAKVDYLLQVTNDNKDEELLEQAQPALVAFVAPWCGHCKALVQPFKKAAKKLKGAEFRFGFVDCDVDNDFCQSHKVKGFPTLKFFNEGKAEDYSGARSEDAFTSFAQDKTGGGGGSGGTDSNVESKLAPTISFSKM
jgi:protein disulfide-isomerase A1